MRKVESDRLQSTRLAEAVARNYFKLLAYKDEYEVARLQSDPAFRARIASQFEGDYKLNFHLAPPLLARPDPLTGKVQKMHFGPWMMTAFEVLARLKFLRGSALDVFGYTAERRTERALIGEYEALVDELLTRLGADNHALAVQLASLPDEIRGFGHVKERNLATTRPNGPSGWHASADRRPRRSSACRRRLPKLKSSFSFFARCSRFLGAATPCIKSS